MFDRLFRRAERKIDSVVAKYVRRVIVAVPLLIAAAFATAAISVKVVEVYGPVNGYAMMAGGFAALAAVIAIFAFASAARTPVEEAEASAASENEKEKMRDGDESPLVPPELLSVLAAAAPAAIPGVARAAARNLPLLVALAIIGYLFTRFAGRTPPGDEAMPTPDVPDNEPADSTSSGAEPTDMAARMAARAAAA